MNWDYVAGFFDGEGNAHVAKRGGAPVVSFAQSDREPLDAIREFIAAGRIYVKPPGTSGTRKTAYNLAVAKTDELRRIVPELLARCIVKHEDLLKVEAALVGRRSRPDTWGSLESLGTAEMRRLYEEEGLSGAEIASLLGVHTDSVWPFFKRHGIAMRSKREALIRAGRWKLTGITPEQMRTLYWDKQLSLTEIGERLGVSPNAISHFLRRHSIPTRSMSAACQLRDARKRQVHTAPIG